MAGQDVSGFMDFYSRESKYIMSAVMDILVLVPAFFWMRYLNKSGKAQTKEDSRLRGKTWLRLAILGILIQLGTDFVLNLMYFLLPAAMKSYTQTMESLGMFSPTFFSMLYTVVLAPVTEELLYRGLTMKILEKEFPFWAANILQALYFAAMHGQPVQSTYAFFIGIVLGYIVRKRKTLKASVICHFAVNLSGVLLGGVSVGSAGFFGGTVVLGLFLFITREKNNQETIS